MIDPQRLQAAYTKVRRDLMSRQVDRHWEGQLASSALSTATAISALSLAQQPSEQSSSTGDSTHDEDGGRIAKALGYLLQQQNADGGWGDTDKSKSNIATTMLSVAAIHLAQRATALGDVLSRAQRYIERQGNLDGLRRRYGKDKTFAVPILTNCALAGLVDWSEVSPLPFELACVPQRFYHLTRMPVVSYAVPALVAIGQARFLHLPPRWPWMRALRRGAVPGSLRVLQRMQPASGGYLEAVPLTSFVVMSLAATGRQDHVVTQRGLEFLRSSQREDGSFPIDTNLATWNTTLAINALASSRTDLNNDLLGSDEDLASHIDLDWLLQCQHTERHPFTGARRAVGAGRIFLGAVPDADDTAGALLALAQLYQSPTLDAQCRARIATAAQLGVTWLLDLQNRDGGWPTFCRGWGKLPFDRSGADLTAHAARALHAWRHELPTAEQRIARALKRGWQYLQRQQRADGSWVPLWFGNQDHPAEENPVFGTARVLHACHRLGWGDTPHAQRGYKWLESVQLDDGGWSGLGAHDAVPDAVLHSSVEETALAVTALLGDLRQFPADRWTPANRGLEWLIEAVLADRHTENAPIGFYFAKLWYHEQLYPLVFAAAALGQAMHQWPPNSTHTPAGSTTKTDSPGVGPTSPAP